MLLSTEAQFSSSPHLLVNGALHAEAGDPDTWRPTTRHKLVIPHGARDASQNSRYQDQLKKKPNFPFKLVR